MAVHINVQFLTDILCFRIAVSCLLSFHQLRNHLTPLRLLRPLLFHKASALLQTILRPLLQNNPLRRIRTVPRPLRGALELVRVRIFRANEGEPVRNELLRKGELDVGLMREGECAVGPGRLRR